MLIGTIFGIIVVPGLYFIFGSLKEKYFKGSIIETENEEMPLSELEQRPYDKP
jgi:hypothetical protein